MDDMCDDALGRMLAFSEGGLVRMKEAGDAYFSKILERNDLLNNVEYETVLRARIVDIHNDLIGEDLPDYAVHLGGAAIITLARQAEFLGAQQTVIVPTAELADDKVREMLTLNHQQLHDRQPVPIATFRLGSYGVASLVLGPTDDAWELYYESRRRAVRFLSN